jgi:hypothetical protein
MAMPLSRIRRIHHERQREVRLARRVPGDAAIRCLVDAGFRTGLHEIGIVRRHHKRRDIQRQEALVPGMERLAVIRALEDATA